MGTQVAFFGCPFAQLCVSIQDRGMQLITSCTYNTLGIFMEELKICLEGYTYTLSRIVQRNAETNRPVCDRSTQNCIFDFKLPSASSMFVSQFISHKRIGTE